MNLATTLELYAGGPGSGCRGGNCGRPRGKGTARTVPKRWVRQSYQTPTGSYTILKPSRRGLNRMGPRSAKRLRHKAAGQFKKDFLYNKNGRTVQFYKALKLGGKEGEGTTLMLDKTVGRAPSVTEVAHGEYGHIARTQQFHFGSRPQAGRFLSKRYGIEKAFARERG